MGKLIATTQAVVDSVIGLIDEQVQTDADHGDYSFERQVGSGGLVLERKTYEGWQGTDLSSRASVRTWMS